MMADGQCWLSSAWLLLTLLCSFHCVADCSMLPYDHSNKGNLEIHKRDVFGSRPAFPAEPSALNNPFQIQNPIRLVNGKKACEGRLEIFYEGEWGTVCDDDWDMVDASVVCRQLQCGQPQAKRTTAYFGPGAGPILMDNVECEGFEAELGQCRNAGWGVHNCSHYEDVGVQCKELPSGGKDFGEFTTPWPTSIVLGVSSGDIRLMNGSHECEGRVEIFHNGVWGTVCDDDWSMKNAHVVCWQLNCGVALAHYGKAYFQRGTGEIFLDNVNCQGYEDKLEKCQHLGWGTHNCGHHEDAGVTCAGFTTTQPSETGITTVTDQVTVTNNANSLTSPTIATSTPNTSPPATASSTTAYSTTAASTTIADTTIAPTTTTTTSAAATPTTTPTTTSAKTTTTTTNAPTTTIAPTTTSTTTTSAPTTTIATTTTNAPTTTIATTTTTNAPTTTIATTTTTNAPTTTIATTTTNAPTTTIATTTTTNAPTTTIATTTTTNAPTTTISPTTTSTTATTTSATTTTIATTTTMAPSTTSAATTTTTTNAPTTTSATTTMASTTTNAPTTTIATTTTTNAPTTTIAATTTTRNAPTTTIATTTTTTTNAPTTTIATTTTTTNAPTTTSAATTTTTTVPTTTSAATTTTTTAPTTTSAATTTTTTAPTTTSATTTASTTTNAPTTTIATTTTIPATSATTGTSTTTGKSGGNRDLFPSSTTHAATTATTTTKAPTTVKLPAPIRLVNGAHRCQGRVEIMYYGQWGTVCDDGWQLSNAVVVCAQLQCGSAVAALSQAAFGVGNGPIYLDNVDCVGNEAGLSFCSNLGPGNHNCNHNEDAAVICELYGISLQSGKLSNNLAAPGVLTPKPVTTAPPSTPPSGTLRLVGGHHSCEGRVEVFLQYEWGTVCDDAWDLPDAQVVCRQVGCGHAIEAVPQARFGAGTGSIQMDNLKCLGLESSLMKCSYIPWNVHNCDHSEDAGVICQML